MNAQARQEPKWRRRAEQRPDEILDAALLEFERVGFDAARVEDIAQRAGLSKAGVYLYFDAKDAILRGLIEREVAPVARRFRALAQSGLADPVAAMRMIIAALTEFLADRSRFAVPRIVVSVASRYPDIAAYYRTNVVDHALEAATALHGAGVAQGVFRPFNSGVAARAIIGPLFMHGFYTHLLNGDAGSLSAAERARVHGELLLNGLMAAA